MTGDTQILKAGNVFANTNLSAAVATVAVLCITWIRYKKPDVSMALNDSLAGLFYTGDASFLGVQVLGVASVALWVTVVMTIVFFILKKTIGLRVSREVEISGLDSTEHNLPSAYADFMPMLPATGITGSSEASVQKPAAMPSMDEAAPVQVIPTEPAGTPGASRITKITIITR